MMGVLKTGLFHFDFCCQRILRTVDQRAGSKFAYVRRRSAAQLVNSDQNRRWICAENHAFLTFTAWATHFLWSTTHRLWSCVNETWVCSNESTCTECSFYFHRSGLDSDCKALEQGPKLEYICLSEGVHVGLATEGKNMFMHNSFQIIYKCEFVWSISCYFLVWASCSNHCLAALDLGADVEQPFGSLIVQNRQAMQSIRRSMDWTLEENMVDGLFFCATLTGRIGSHTPFVQAGAETSDTGVEAVKPVCPPTPHSIDDPPTAPHVCCCCQMNWWDVRHVQMGVSI